MDESYLQPFIRAAEELRHQGYPHYVVAFLHRAGGVRELESAITKFFERYTSPDCDLAAAVLAAANLRSSDGQRLIDQVHACRQEALVDLAKAVKKFRPLLILE